MPAGGRQQAAARAAAVRRASGALIHKQINSAVRGPDTPWRYATVDRGSCERDRMSGEDGAADESVPQRRRFFERPGFWVACFVGLAPQLFLLFLFEVQSDGADPRDGMVAANSQLTELGGAEACFFVSVVAIAFLFWRPARHWGAGLLIGTGSGLMLLIVIIQSWLG
jgi:hypothetical protein